MGVLTLSSDSHNLTWFTNKSRLFIAIHLPMIVICLHFVSVEAFLLHFTCLRLHSTLLVYRSLNALNSYSHVSIHVILCKFWDIAWKNVEWKQTNADKFLDAHKNKSCDSASTNHDWIIGSEMYRYFAPVSPEAMVPFCWTHRMETALYLHMFYATFQFIV